MKYRHAAATVFALSRRLLQPRKTLSIALAMASLGLLSPTALAATDTACLSTSYDFGFRELHDTMGPLMGDPMSCEYADPSGNGDVLEKTTLGLAYWRTGTNIPTYTDGVNHWAINTNGLVYWSGGSLDVPANAQLIKDLGGSSVGVPDAATLIFPAPSTPLLVAPFTPLVPSTPSPEIIGSNGSQKTAPFTLNSGNYSVNWSSTAAGRPGNFAVTLYGLDATTQDLIANDILAAGETKSIATNVYDLAGGQYYLDVLASGTWKVTFTAQ